MKKTILSVALLTTFSGLFAQRSVTTVERIPAIEIGTSRGTDTLVLSSLAGELALSGSQGGGWVTGTNGYGDLAKAQEFMMSGPATIDEVLFLFAKSVTAGGPTSMVNARIYHMDGTGATTAGDDMPAPGTMLAEESISIDEIDTTMLMGINIGPVWVNGHFAAGIDFSDLAAGDSIAIVHTAEENVDMTDRSWELWSDDTWHTLAAAWPMNIDLVIAPVFTPSSVGVNDGTWVNNMRMSFLGGNPVNENVIVKFENQMDAVMGLQVIDAAGRIVLQQDLGNRSAGLHTYELLTNNWNAGVYYVTLKANGQPMTLKLAVK
ncbi:MAG: T9SS type A sorting domain-containing protein [Bacteroidota bacterium]|nr:T9SS type A sorting domain-containing protein [Bacteroidota bacterium]